MKEASYKETCEIIDVVATNFTALAQIDIRFQVAIKSLIYSCTLLVCCMMSKNIIG